MTEKQYRDLDIDSYSSIKVFIEDRKKYYKKFILKEPIKEESSDSLIFGNLVDCLLFTPEEYDNRFTLSTSQIPTGQYGKFVEELMRVTIQSVDDNGVVTRGLEDMMEEAYKNVKFDRNGNIVDFKRDSFDTVKSKFLGSDLEVHYRQMRESFGKQVIEKSMLENAQNVVNELKSNFVTKEVINIENSDKHTVYNQYPIVGQLEGTVTGSLPFPAKCLVDKLVIDHEQKSIHIFDLKTAWDNENEFEMNYFKYKYYIQAAVYFYLVVEWKKKIKEIADYSVNYPKFIVAESSNYKNPLIYTTDGNHFQQGMRGFMIRNRYHSGVLKAVREIMWHKENGIWNISKENYEKKGLVKIKYFE